VNKSLAQRGVAERHAMIVQAHREGPDVSLRKLCAWFGVSRSHLLEHLAGLQPSEEEVAVRDAIERLVLAFPGYGYRRVTHALVRDGWTINHQRVLRIMHEEALLCQLKKRFVATTQSQHEGPVYPNRLRTVVPDTINQAWVADITSIRLPTTFVSVASLLDAFSRRCVGWRLARDIDTALTLAALEHALTARQPAPGWIHHSDRGVQDASTAYVARLQQAGAAISMSAKGTPYDNAKAESFFKTLKREEVYLNAYRTFDEAEHHIARFIEDVSNWKRLHSSLGYVPPAEFEASHARPSTS